MMLVCIIFQESSLFSTETTAGLLKETQSCNHFIYSRPPSPQTSCLSKVLLTTSIVYLFEPWLVKMPTTGKHVCPALWKNTQSGWSLRWKIIPLFEWQTVKNTLSGTILFKIFWKIYHFSQFCRFRYPNWVIWVTQPILKKYLFTQIPPPALSPRLLTLRAQPVFSINVKLWRT